MIGFHDPAPASSRLAKVAVHGASEETQEIYRLLHEHPEGMTVGEVHDELRDGWMATDVYRASPAIRDDFRTTGPS